MNKDGIVSVCTGQKHYEGTLTQGEVVELKIIEGSEYVNNIGVFNQEGVQCGSIINKRYDSDIVDGVLNNDMIIGFMDDYDWVAVKVYNHKSFLKAVPKAEHFTDQTIENMTAHVETLKESLHVIIVALDNILGDIQSLQKLKTEIESTVKCYNDLSNEFMAKQNELSLSKGTSKVFDYYSKEAAK